MAVFYTHADGMASGARVAVCSETCSMRVRRHRPGTWSGLVGGVEPPKNNCVHCACCGGVVSPPAPGYDCRLHDPGECPLMRVDLTLYASVTAAMAFRLGGLRPFDDEAWQRLLDAIENELVVHGYRFSTTRVLSFLGYEVP